MYCKINCGYHGQRWGFKNVLHDQLSFPRPKMRFQKMYCKINCGFHGQRWGFKNVLQGQLWFPRPKMRLQECIARSIVVSTAKNEVTRMYWKISCGFYGQRWGFKDVLQDQLANFEVSKTTSPLEYLELILIVTKS